MKKSIDLLLMFYVASLIVFALPSNVLYSNIMGVAFASVYVLYKILYRQHKIFFPKVILFYFIFVVFATLSSFWSVDFQISMEQNFLNLKVFIILFVISNAVIELKNVLFIFYGVFVGIVVNYAIYFGLYVPGYLFWDWNRFMGTTGNPNVLAIASIFSIFSTIVIIHVKRIRSFLLLGLLYINLSLSVYMIIASASKKGIIFGSLLIIWYLVSLLKHKRQLITLGIGMSLILMPVLLFVDLSTLMDHIGTVSHRMENLVNALLGQGTEQSSQERLTYITEGFWLGGDYPLLGHGIATFILHFGRYAHNNYIELFYGLGFIGVILYYAMYVTVLKNILNLHDFFLKYTLFGFVIVLLFMDVALVSYYMKLLLIMLIAVYHLSQSEKTDHDRVARFMPKAHP